MEEEQILALKKVSENCRFLMFQLNDYKENFENEFGATSKTEKQFLQEIKSDFDTITADVLIFREKVLAALSVLEFGGVDEAIREYQQCEPVN